MGLDDFTWSTVLHHSFDRLKEIDSERLALKASIRALFSEAKKAGFEKHIIKHYLSLRKIDLTPSPTNNMPPELQPIIEKIETLKKKRRHLKGKRKSVLLEALEYGFDGNVLKILVKISRQDPDVRKDKLSLCNLYRRNLGAHYFNV